MKKLIVHSQQFSVNNKRGFTLMELLVVILIIGILTTIGLNAFNASQVKARDSKRKTDLKLIASALEKYRSQESVKTYPLPAWAPCPSNSEWSCSNSTANPWISGLAPNYISKMPNDPKQESGPPCGISGVSNTYATAKFAYGYFSIDGHQFVLSAKLENQNDKTSTGYNLPDPRQIFPFTQGRIAVAVQGCFFVKSP